MKKTVLLFILSISLFSCSKHSSQEEVVKNDMKSLHNISDNEMDMYKIEVSELLGKDANTMVYKYCHKDFESNMGLLDTLVKSKKYQAYKDKTYYNVLAYRLSGNDTVAKSIYFLTDKNKIFFREYLR